MKFSRPLLGLLFLALIAIGVYQSLNVQTPDRPVGTHERIAEIKDGEANVVLILVDTLRADRLSSWGYERETSPIMDALADSGIRFANTLAQSTWTKTSMASMFTATYPAKNKITRFNHVIPSGATLAPEILQDAGFRTVGIWRNGWVSPSFGFDQGWDFYVKPNRDTATQIQNPSSIKLGGTDQSITKPALQFLRSVGDERFFLYLHYMDVHQYVYDGAVDFGLSYSDIYDQSIHWVDANIGSVVATLQQQGLMKNTILAIVSDHGEAFLEHGHEGHALSLHREVTHVPFILTLPFRLEEPIVVESPVENVDIMPTIFDLLGLPELPEADGKSLLPLVEAAARGEEEPFDPADPRFAYLDKMWGRPNEEPRAYMLIEKDGYRLHDYAETATKLYDANADSTENTNLASTDPERVNAMRILVQEHLKTPPASWGGPGWVAIDDMEAAQLRALGYAFDPHAPPAQRKLEP